MAFTTLGNGWCANETTSIKRIQVFIVKGGKHRFLTLPSIVQPREGLFRFTAWTCQHPKLTSISGS
jgi:hypothetical protein